MSSQNKKWKIEKVPELYIWRGLLIIMNLLLIRMYWNILIIKLMNENTLKSITTIIMQFFRVIERSSRLSWSDHQNWRRFFLDWPFRTRFCFRWKPIWQSALQYLHNIFRWIVWVRIHFQVGIFSRLQKWRVQHKPFQHFWRFQFWQFLRFCSRMDWNS